jgi:hypothetical protein
LLEAAERASPGVRIDYRDPIAGHGARAIVPMFDWLPDSRLGAFAVRVLARIADEPALRRQVLAALQNADLATLPEPVVRDVSDLLSRSGGAAQRPAQVGQERSMRRQQWPGDRAVSPLELRFHDAMLDVFRRAGEATRRRRPDGTIARGYWASYFLRGVRNNGGPEYARHLLRARGTTAGFQRLKDEGRLDLTMEALVLQPEYSALFSENERQTAADRLRAAGYDPAVQHRGGPSPD